MDLINSKEVLQQLMDEVGNGCYDFIKENHAKFIELFERNMNSQVKTREVIRN